MNRHEGSSGELVLEMRNITKLYEAAALIESGKYDFRWLVTSVLPVEEAGRGFELLTGTEKRDLKILLQFDGV
ncbi:MAG: hypothetical protein LBB68_02890 [Treponema sp.]|jgi:threonine dehydrogenase-like Zn-dependent dehydrogenase|nr:hypothetical protein [Treponema sp.]